MTKDHCTFSPEGNWGGTCCKQHDVAYGNTKCTDTRLSADWDLAKCITKAAPHWSLRPIWGIIGAVYFTGVRVGGSPRFQQHVCKLKKAPEWKDPDKQ